MLDAPVRQPGYGTFHGQLYSLGFMSMMFRRSAFAFGTFGLVLLSYASHSAAHGVDVSADVDGATATLELTDETGEVCIAVDPAPENSAVHAIVDEDSNEVLLILGEGFGADESCQFFDVDVVNGILADVDAHRLVIAFGGSESSGQLTKPVLPESETATGAAPTEAETSETNTTLVFGAGIALGVLAVVVRKRFFS